MRPVRRRLAAALVIPCCALAVAACGGDEEPPAQAPSAAARAELAPVKGFLLAHTVEDEEPLEILRIDPSLEGKQIGRVQAVRARREGAAVEASLGALREAAARPEHNLMDELLACARAHATEGEIVTALQDVWGSYTEVPVF